MSLDLQTLVGGKPLKAKGTIENPGDLAHVVLDFEGEALPIDETLFNALPPDICKVVKEFQPTGSVGGHAHVDRTPPVRPGDPAEGVVKFDAELKLNEGCAMKWVGLPYPVSNLTGRARAAPRQLGVQEHAGDQRPGGHHGFGQGRAALPPTSSRSTSASRARACRSTTSCAMRCRRPGRRPGPRSTRTARATWTRRSGWRRGSPTFTTW